MKKLIVLPMVLLIALLFGCAPQGGVAEPTDAPPEATEAPEDTPLETVPAETAEPESDAATPEKAEDRMPEDAVILFKQEGGIAGVMEEYVIYADGRVTRNDEAVLTVGPEAVTGVVDTLEATGFFELESAGRTDLCCDRFVYTLSVRGDSGVHTVTAVDGEEIPEAFSTALGEVQRLIAGTGGPAEE